MDYLKGLNVIILSLLLILTGCFGMLSDDEEDSVEAESTDDTTTVTATLTAQDIADAMILASNSPPKVSVKTFDFTIEDWEDTELFRNNWLYSGFFNCLDDPESLQNEDGTHIGYTLEEQRESVAELASDLGVRHLANMIELGDCVLYFDFVSVDPDGDSMTKGIDTDFDGIIDIPITPNDGMVLVGVDNSTNKDVFNGLMASSCEQIDVAFIAIDEHGASTAEFMHFLGVETCDDDEFVGATEGGIGEWSFSGIDDIGSGDGSVIVTLDDGGEWPLNAFVIEVSIDGAAPLTVTPCPSIGSDNCISAYSDWWNNGESITIDTECDGLCTIVVNIMDADDGTVLGTVTIDTE